MYKLRVVYDAPPPNPPSPAQASEFDLLDIQVSFKSSSYIISMQHNIQF